MPLLNFRAASGTCSPYQGEMQTQLQLYDFCFCLGSIIVSCYICSRTASADSAQNFCHARAQQRLRAVRKFRIAAACPAPKQKLPRTVGVSNLVAKGSRAALCSAHTFYLESVSVGADLGCFSSPCGLSGYSPSPIDLLIFGYRQSVSLCLVVL